MVTNKHILLHINPSVFSFIWSFITMHNNHLTLNEAADYLNISRSFLYKLNKSGKVRSYKFGRVYRFLVSDLDEFLKHNVTNPFNGK